MLKKLKKSYIKCVLLKIEYEYEICFTIWNICLNKV